MPPSVPARAGLPGAIATAYLALCAATLLAAAATAASGALPGSFAPTRRHPRGVDAAVSICLTNGRAALIALACAALVGCVPAWRPILDVALGALALLNTGVVGAAIAAAGPTVAARWLAQLPVEWLGFAAPAGAYLLARHTRQRPAQLAHAGALGLLALAAAALLETLAVPL